MILATNFPLNKLATPNLLNCMRYLQLGLLAICALANPACAADNKQPVVNVENAWARATNPGQEVGAAYMTLTSAEDVSLISAGSNVSDSVEIHSMSMQNGVMKMRMLDTLALTAGKPYKLEPGGFHLMLFDLKKPLNAGSEVSFYLHFKTKGSKPVQFKQTVTAKVLTDSH